MPELPEVETTRRAVNDIAVGQTISSVIVRHHQLRLPVPHDLSNQCIGKTICSISRRGKYLIINLSRGYFLIHLGMSGHLRISKSFALAKKHDHIELQLGNNTIIRYHDPRRFGLWLYLETNPLNHPLLSRLGIEPLTEKFNGQYLFHLINKKKQSIKHLIMNNAVVVGVGNIYATESLFKAGINPSTSGHDIRLDQCIKLVGHIKSTLKTAIHAGGTTLRDFSSGDGTPGYFSQNLAVYGRTNFPCFECGDIIANVKIAGRSSAFCPTCQPIISN